MMPRGHRRTARIEVRITPDASAEEAQLIRLTVEDQRRFVDCLLNPPELPSSLLRAKEAHSRLVRAHLPTVKDRLP
jgi:uncharacterized protein (DUF1778 family)